MIGKYEKPLPELQRFVKQNALPVMPTQSMSFRGMPLRLMRETDHNTRRSM
jgi:hypothetical protein